MNKLQKAYSSQPQSFETIRNKSCAILEYPKYAEELILISPGSLCICEMRLPIDDYQFQEITPYLPS